MAQEAAQKRAAARKLQEAAMLAAEASAVRAGCDDDAYSGDGGACPEESVGGPDSASSPEEQPFSLRDEADPEAAMGDVSSPSPSPRLSQPANLALGELRAGSGDGEAASRSGTEGFESPVAGPRAAEAEAAEAARKAEEAASRARADAASRDSVEAGLREQAAKSDLLAILEMEEAERARARARAEEAEAARRDGESQAKDKEKMEAERRAEEARRAQEARLADEKRRAEEARLEEEERRAEQERRTEAARRAEEEIRLEEEKRAEAARRVEEEKRAEAARQAEEAKRAEDNDIRRKVNSVV